jgi:hypothetical protein
MVFSALSSSGRASSMRSSAALAIGLSRSQPIHSRPSRLATAPVVPVPKNGSSTTSPLLVVASITR